MNLPSCETLKLELDQGCLRLWLNRPSSRNAMSRQMAEEIIAVFSAIEHDRSIRFVVIRGVEGNFCSGGDIKDMAGVADLVAGKQDPLAVINHRFGQMLQVVDAAPQIVIAVLEGVVMGGGFGLACVSDIALALRDAKLAMPEVTIGLPPAQIAPYVALRIGMTQTRRLALTGARFDGQYGQQLGLIHEVADNLPQLEEKLAETLAQCRKAAPCAVAATKMVLRGLEDLPMSERLREAANLFASALRSDEGRSGALAFMTKKPAPWVGS